ncbi:hypothetical protein FJTKL_12449 [Diaporthe vaccinii]|uniref:Uncharacterized protein n=1 Tax=Diaporthe vaccinii TaxID=105482 RepID=A0ABR4EDF9_9PEZI
MLDDEPDESFPHGPAAARWEVPFCPNFLQPLCNHLNLLPNLPILRAVQNFHDTTILLHLLISSYFIVFFLTPTAIALSNLHEGPFPPRTIRPDPTRPELRVPSCPSLLLLPGFWLLPHLHLDTGASPSILLDLAPTKALRDSPIDVLSELLGNNCTARSLGAQLPTPDDADANSVPPRPQSLVPSLIFRPRPKFTSTMGKRKQIPASKSESSRKSNARINPGLGATTKLIPTASTPGASNP